MIYPFYPPAMTTQITSIHIAQDVKYCITFSCQEIQDVSQRSTQLATYSLAQYTMLGKLNWKYLMAIDSVCCRKQPHYEKAREEPQNRQCKQPQGGLTKELTEGLTEESQIKRKKKSLPSEINCKEINCQGNIIFPHNVLFICFNKQHATELQLLDSTV